MDVKILMFGWEFPPHNSGGLGTACLGLTKALARAGVNITFVLPKTVGVNPDFMNILFADTKNVRFRGIETILSAYMTPKSYTTALRYAKRRRGLANTLIEEVYRYGVEARRIAREEDFDIIHTHDWLSFVAGIEAQKESKKPFVAHVHATEFDRTAGHGANTLVYEIEKMGLEHSSRVLAVSNLTKQKIVKHYGVEQQKISVVYNGINTEEWQGYATLAKMEALKRSGGKIVLFLGRITIQKGPEYFVRAAKKVLEYEPNTTFIVSGSGDMQEQIMREVAYLGIGDKVLFSGFLRGEELKSMYKVADLYIMPSVSEPFGITPLESIASGVPVIISRQSGVSEILTHALKVDFWDTDELANKIVGVLRHRVLKDTMDENGRKEVESISWDKVAHRCIDTYKKVFNKPKNA